MEKLIFMAATALCAVSSLSAREYIFIYEQKTWLEAQSYCRERYTDLVTIESLEVVKILQSLANLTQLVHPAGYPAWIGLYDNLDIWTWSMSNSTFYQASDGHYRNWASEAPDNSDGREACAAIDSRGVWNDVSCSFTLYPVCSDFNETEERFVYINTTMNWPAALKYCREHHTDLAIVRNLEENKEIHGLNPAESLWIGLYRPYWMWSDGTRRRFTYWGKEEPNGPKDCCAAANFASSAKWEDWNCEERIGFICYWEFPVLTRVVRLKLVKTSSLDLNDPAVMETLLDQLQQKLKEQKEAMKIRNLRWRKQLDGKVFHKK